MRRAALISVTPVLIAAIFLLFNVTTSPEHTPRSASNSKSAFHMRHDRGPSALLGAKILFNRILRRVETEGALDGYLVTEPLALLTCADNATVSAELKLVPEQRRAIANANLEIRSAINELQLSQNSQDFLAKHANRFDDINRQAERLLRAILTQEQFARLREIGYRAEILERGLGEAFTVGEIAQDAGILDNQHEQLLRKASEIESEVSKQAEVIREAGLQKLLDELHPDQRTKVQQMLGNPAILKRHAVSDDIRKHFENTPNPRKAPLVPPM